MNPAPPRPAAKLAAEIARPLPLSDAAKALLTPQITVRQFFEALLAVPLNEDAIRFLAASLPKRQSVWWGLLCLTESLPKTRPEPMQKALTAVEKWVKDGSEANRRAAGDAAEAAGYSTEAGCLAAGAFWSGGSLAPANLPAVPPRDDLTGQAVAGSMLLTAVIDPSRGEAMRQRFLAIGQEIATGIRKL